MESMYAAIRRKEVVETPIHYCEIIDFARDGWRIGTHLCKGLLNNMSNAKSLSYDRYEILYEMTRDEFNKKISDESLAWTNDNIGWQDKLICFTKN